MSFMKILASLVVACFCAGQIHASTQMYFIHNDHLGTPQVVTDQNQSVVWKGEQKPFGEVEETTAAIEQFSRFPGQYFEEESGLHYNYFRDYDPSTGRYIQSDPIGLDGGLNTYGYVYQNPLRYTDPLGLDVSLVCRPLKGFLGSLGGKHCAVIVEEDPNSCSVGDRQFSLQYGGQSPLEQWSYGNDVYDTDRNAFENPGGRNEVYPIATPENMTPNQFDQAVSDSGDNYQQGPYNPVLGPNSNTAADNIIENAGGITPTVPGAVGQQYGDYRSSNGGSGRVR